jgi:hypothetical protein
MDSIWTYSLNDAQWYLIADIINLNWETAALIVMIIKKIIKIIFQFFIFRLPNGILL